METTRLGNTWVVSIWKRVLRPGQSATREATREYEVVLGNIEEPCLIAVSLFLNRADLIQIARWDELLRYNLTPPDPLYRLLSAAIEAGSDPTLRRLTQEAAYKVSALVRAVLED